MGIADVGQVGSQPVQVKDRLDAFDIRQHRLHPEAAAALPVAQHAVELLHQRRLVAFQRTVP
ncbi:hypothetical protein SDC9_157587 [bioreactor metagenome]|uniref:Uncharacterized protein n=1 Tax=bioreactor metagenome TaxID=1076179 RepID=A0A645F9Q5_9ZZZZ